jgi:hypothetical protein
MILYRQAQEQAQEVRKHVPPELAFAELLNGSGHIVAYLRRFSKEQFRNNK